MSTFRVRRSGAPHHLVWLDCGQAEPQGDDMTSTLYGSVARLLAGLDALPPSQATVSREHLRRSLMGILHDAADEPDTELRMWAVEQAVAVAGYSETADIFNVADQFVAYVRMEQP